eukprot:scaffold20349_cov54-Phaeocystis_antarctica.AAC.1
MCVGPNAPTHAGPGRGGACTRLGGSSSCRLLAAGLESNASARRGTADRELVPTRVPGPVPGWR